MDYKTIALVICFPVIGYFLIREIRNHDAEKQTMTAALQQLTLVVGELKHAVENVRLWVDGRFTRKIDHDKDIEELRAEMERRFEKHGEDCPARRDYERRR